MKTSEKGKQLIRKHEGLRLEAYRCPSGVLTIGYGHTRGVTAGMRITQQEADRMLDEDLTEAERTVNGHNLKINQNQFDALVSFVFNLGSGNFNSSTLLKCIKANPANVNIRYEFGRWIRSNGKPLAGLAARRKDEAALYFS